MAPSDATTARSYDGRRRRERAAQQRVETRRRILAAATALFLERGFAGTTLAAIAAAAGVSVQTLYSNIGGKLELLRAVGAVAVTGSDEAGGVLDQPWVQELAVTADPLEQLRLLSAASTELARRAGPFWQLLAEAAVDEPRLAAQLRAHETDRMSDQREILRMVGGIDPDLGVERALDILNAVASPQVWVLLTERGWTPGEIEQFLFRTLALHLLHRVV